MPITSPRPKHGAVTRIGPSCSQTLGRYSPSLSPTSLEDSAWSLSRDSFITRRAGQARDRTSDADNSVNREPPFVHTGLQRQAAAHVIRIIQIKPSY